MNFMDSKLFNQPKLETEGLRCDVHTFKNNSAVGEQCPAADTKVMPIKHNGRQSQVF
jgi:hypothetical protein